MHGFSFPIVHAEWSHVFWSFRMILRCVEKYCFKLNNNNNSVFSTERLPLWLPSHKGSNLCIANMPVIRFIDLERL